MINTDASTTLKFLEKKLEKIGMEYICIILFILCSMTLVFLTPPLQIPDEPNHLVRAYQISEGVFCSPSHHDTEGRGYFYGEIPTSFLKLSSYKEVSNNEFAKHNFNIPDIFNSEHTASRSFMLYILNTPLEPSNSDYYYIPNTGQYTPVAYLPQAFGAWIGRNLDLSVGTTFYLMRSMSVLFVATSIFISIKILKEERLLIFILAMMPMFMYESASISADAVTLALSVLITSYFLSLCHRRVLLSWKDYLILIFFAISLGLIKQVYGVLLLLYFLIPHKLIGSKLKFYSTGLMLMATFFFTSMWWISFMYNGTSLQVVAGPGANPAEQLQMVKENPLQYLMIYFFTLKSNFISWYYPQFIGVFGWLAVFLPAWFYNLYCIFLVTGALFNNLRLSLKQRSLISLSTATAVSVIFLNQYITWAPLGAPSIEGVQGRYFIPLALMFFSALSCQKSLKFENIIGCTAGLLSAIVTILSIVDYFY